MRPALSDYQHLASGKVRELYRIDDDHLLFVASDRISAFDYILDNRDPRQGPHPDRDERVLLRLHRGAQPSRRSARRPAHPRRGARPRAGGAQARDDSRRVRRARLPHRLRADRLPEDRRGLRHRAAAGSDRGQQVRRRRCSPRPPRPSSASTTRTSRSPTSIDLVGAVRANQLRDLTLQTYMQAADHALTQGNHHRRHQVRVRRRRAAATWCWPTRSSPPTRRGTGPPTPTARVSCSPASTSSSSATG